MTHEAAMWFAGALVGGGIGFFLGAVFVIAKSR